MSVEINVVSMRCGAKNGGLSCVYCYESPLVADGYPLPSVDVPAVKAAVERMRPGSSGFSLFGGEPLLAPLPLIEDLWAWGLEKYGKNGVQTSGRPIREEHYALFHRYKVSVGFSIDGPEELNEARSAGSPSMTRAATDHAIAALERCLREGLNVSLIVTLSRWNASEDRLPRLLEWFSRLDELGLHAVGLHLLQQDKRTASIALTQQENLAALIAIHQHQVHGLRRIRFDMFRDVVALLRGKDTWKWNDGTAGGVGCTWNACDPLTTPAVQGVEPDGSRALCPRVHQTGVAWSDAPRGPLVRQLALRATPYEQGGCQGCRQLITCKGQCPGMAIGGDWRKRSRDCETWRGLLEHFEGVLLAAGETPVTLRPDRDEIEERMAEWWTAGRAVRLTQVLAGERPPVNQVDHEDHTDHEDHDDLGPLLGALKSERVVA